MKKVVIEQLDFGYSPGEPLFRNLNLELGSIDENGHVTALMGSSGSGKTTLLKLLLGVLRPQSGNIEYRPDDAVFSYVPQDPVLFEHLSPMDNARYFLHASRLKGRFDENRFQRLLKLLEIDSILEQRKHVNDLSGGQKQRLSLLRALSIQPEILLLDEPCTGLDADVKFAFLSKLHELVSELNLFAIYVTHHVDEAKFMGDEVAFIVQDDSTGHVKEISQLPVTEFIGKPPTLDALRIIDFPKINIAGIRRAEGAVRLSSDPESFISLSRETLKLTENPSGIPLQKAFGTGAYACYRHAASQTLVTFDSGNENLADIIHVEISGSFSEYGLDGIFKKVNELHLSN